MVQCEDCGETFQLKSSYRRHLRRFPNPHSFKCDPCGKRFKRIQSLNKHFCPSKTADKTTWNVTIKSAEHDFSVVRVKHEKHAKGPVDEEPRHFDEDDLPLSQLVGVGVTEFRCPTCAWVFTTRSSLARHLRIYLGVHFVYPCCNQPLLRTDNILGHKCLTEVDESSSEFAPSPQPEAADSPEEDDSTDDRLAFTCPSCQRRYSSCLELTKHLKRYPGRHDFNCVKCKRCFLKERQLTAHTCILQGVDAFECSCKETFKIYKTFKKHIGSQSPYYCCKCQRQCKTVNNLINHIRTHTNTKPYQCDVCRKGFTLSGTLKLHVRTHTNERPYHCSKCSYSCSVKHNLRLHEETHNENKQRDKIFLCPVCGSAFGRKHHFNKHVRFHSAVKTSLCRVCGKLFKDSAGLNKHLEIHEGQSDVGMRCVKCGDEFPKQQAYQHHVETSHFDYVCTQCKKVFKSKHNLSKHLDLHKDPGSRICKKKKSTEKSLAM